MNRDAFSGYHPGVNLAFFLAVLSMTMFIAQPVCLVISLVCGLSYLWYLQGSEGLLRQVRYLLPFLLAMTLLNPLFNHEGVTVLGYLPNDNPITLEAIAYGVGASVMMAASIVWFNCLNTVFTSDKIIYLFGRVIPAMSLLISMTLRFVPRFKGHLQRVLQAQRAICPTKTAMNRLRLALSAFSATVSWALEQSIVCADSMKSRGYGLGGRTAFSIYRFCKRDGWLLAVIALLLAGVVIPAALGQLDWVYYPRIAGPLVGTAQLVAYFCYGGVCLLPLTIDLWEDRTWRSLRSEI